MDPSNTALAADFSEIAALLRASRADRFRVRAYERAARVLRALPVAVADLDAAEVRALSGIGPAMAGVLVERLASGRIGMLEELRAQEPPGFGALVDLPLIGLRDARRLAAAHGIRDVAALRAAAADAEQLTAFGKRLAARVRESLRREATVADPRLPLARAQREARALADGLAGLPGVEEVLAAGAVRRGVDLVGDFDLVVGVEPGAAGAVAAALPGSPAVVRALERQACRVRVVTPTGHPALLWTAEQAALGSALLCATGPSDHVARLAERAGRRGLELRPDGLWQAGPRRAARDEAAIYDRLGLPPIPPELREDDTAVEVAAAGRLPALVRAGDLRGDLHVHTDFSGDGTDSMLEVVRGAAGRGYDYIALTDHAENLTINGMPRAAVLARRRTIAEVQQRHPHVRILDAAELNIGLDGALDYDLGFLLDFELGVASVHSHMDRPAAEQTERILSAIAHPAVNVIGHPTGRIIGHRPGYAIDLAAIAQAATETGTALEVNGSPARLDLDAAMIRAAVQAGAMLSLSSDAHSIAELDAIANAVTTARRGWAQASDVLNTRPLDGLLAMVARKRAR